MSTDIKHQRAAWEARTKQTAMTILASWVGEERAREAAGRVVTALQAAALSAKKPEDFYGCSAQSVAGVISIAALTGIMPGVGATSLAWALPRRQQGAMQLQYSLSHRGLAALAMRSGMVLVAVPVGNDDHIVVENGEVVEHRPNIDDPPMTLDALRGCVVIVRRLSGETLFRGWVPTKLIKARRAVSDSAKYDGSPWAKWPVEMAMKTAMKYAVTRGWCVIDDTMAQRAMDYDTEDDLAVETSAQPTAAITVAGAMQSRQLPDYTEAEAIEQAAPAQRETVTVTITTDDEDDTP